MVFIWSLFQEPVTIAGRICCDSIGKLNSKSVVLEASRETSAGKQIPIDLSQVPSYSLFPGQVSKNFYIISQSFKIIRLLNFYYPPSFYCDP